MKGAGSTVQGAAGGLTSAGISGGFTTSEAISQLCAQWSAGMKAFADACNSVASSLEQAGTKYPITENTLSRRY
ncbi:MAG: hypothetical protein M3Y91_18570, partial [Actinomycetota bacterium]|nr:hypothetical protein [Actinomycetota bacterium]